MNPFEFDAAPNLTPEQIRDWFIDDNNYARFITSTRNVLLLGQRGSGKSMTLMYFSLPIQIRKTMGAEYNLEQNRMVGIYVPCNTPLTYKLEYQLFDDNTKPIALSEHYFVMGIAISIADSMDQICDRFSKNDLSQLAGDIRGLLDTELPTDSTIFRKIKSMITTELRQTQVIINSSEDGNSNFRPRTFYTLILPLLNALHDTDLLKSSHFLLMIDDAHDLNDHQKRMLNSWLSYRDHSLFSFKVAIAKASNYNFMTSSGGTILEGHDYISIDLEQPFQNSDSRFGKLARDIISRRLDISGLCVSPDEFFPESNEFKTEIENCRSVAQEEAKRKFSPENKKAINDYMYKYTRAIYFRNRSPKANKPNYSGLDTIIHLSTGVIRNFLDPCYWMYDDALSRHVNKNDAIRFIPPSLQSEIIRNRSEKMWERIRDGLDKVIFGCTSEQAKSIHNIFENLAKLFRDRLLNHQSEPRVISFSISGRTQAFDVELLPLLTIARRAQLLYERSGPSKDDGLRENFYVPNRLLWPAIGLDPVGQHGRISLPESLLLAAAKGQPFPPVNSSITQEKLF
jgi:hypothetical protein